MMMVEKCLQVETCKYSPIVVDPFQKQLSGENICHKQNSDKHIIICFFNYDEPHLSLSILVIMLFQIIYLL